MSTHVWIHNAHKVTAVAGATASAPLTISVSSEDGSERSEMVLFTDNQALTDALAAAINAATPAP